jgi:hypothetical protein
MDVKAPGGESRKVETTEGGSGSHNKPIGCGASGAYAPGPDEEEEELGEFLLY